MTYEKIAALLLYVEKPLSLALKKVLPWIMVLLCMWQIWYNIFDMHHNLWDFTSLQNLLLGKFTILLYVFSVLESCNPLVFKAFFLLCA